MTPRSKRAALNGNTPLMLRWLREEVDELQHSYSTREPATSMTSEMSDIVGCLLFIAKQRKLADETAAILSLTQIALRKIGGK